MTYQFNTFLAYLAIQLPTIFAILIDNYSIKVIKIHEVWFLQNALK